MVNKDSLEQLMKQTCDTYITEPNADGPHLTTIREIKDDCFILFSHFGWKDITIKYSDIVEETTYDDGSIIKDKGGNIISFVKIQTEIVYTDVRNIWVGPPAGDYVRVEVPCVKMTHDVLHEKVLSAIESAPIFYSERVFDEIEKSNRLNCLASLKGFRATVDTNGILTAFRLQMIIPMFQIYFQWNLRHTEKIYDGGYENGKSYVWVAREHLNNLFEVYKNDNTRDLIINIVNREQQIGDWDSIAHYLFDLWYEECMNHEDYGEYYEDEVSFDDNVKVTRIKQK